MNEMLDPKTRKRGWYWLKLKGVKTGIPKYRGGDWLQYYWMDGGWYGHPEIQETDIIGIEDAHQ